jgi:hypothetical protein
MTADTLRIEAPTDAQLGYIASLCREHAIPQPAAIHSKQEASAIIEAMRGGTYNPDDYLPAGPDDDLPFS